MNMMDNTDKLIISNQIHHLKTSICNLVDTFSHIYLSNSSWEEEWYSEWQLPSLFRFWDYYVFSLADIYTALHFQIPKEILLKRYELENPKRINLINYFITHR